eukprot:13492822-Alexandrium_andersonii.AAC.1
MRYALVIRGNSLRKTCTAKRPSRVGEEDVPQRWPKHSALVDHVKHRDRSGRATVDNDGSSSRTQPTQ